MDTIHLLVANFWDSPRNKKFLLEQERITRLSGGQMLALGVDLRLD